MQRNKLIFENEAPDPVGVVLRINYKSNSILWSLNNDNVMDVISNQACGVLICWEPPPHSWVKLNSDGSLVSSTDLATCGGLLHDAGGGGGVYCNYDLSEKGLGFECWHAATLSLFKLCEACIKSNL
ncbi:hypothetical protein RIF29_15263 [Crotalaria pallida]|uniref:Uncharacterized protein n=1 Tax=Crotalaria pallida TaxID=3830 RepID=A0AAN9FD85_CROPI